MAKYQIAVPAIDIEAGQEISYMGAQMHRIRQPLGFWLCFRIFQKHGKKSEVSGMLEKILVKAYNAGLMDEIRGIDSIVRDAFGDLARAKSTPRKARRKQRKASPSPAADKLTSALDSALE